MIQYLRYHQIMQKINKRWYNKQKLVYGCNLFQIRKLCIWYCFRLSGDRINKNDFGIPRRNANGYYNTRSSWIDEGVPAIKINSPVDAGLFALMNIFMKILYILQILTFLLWNCLWKLKNTSEKAIKKRDSDAEKFEWKIILFFDERHLLFGWIHGKIYPYFDVSGYYAITIVCYAVTRDINTNGRGKKHEKQ